MKVVMMEILFLAMDVKEIALVLNRIGYVNHELGNQIQLGQIHFSLGHMTLCVSKFQQLFNHLDQLQVLDRAQWLV